MNNSDRKLIERDPEIEYFNTLLTDKPPKKIWPIYGPGGIGKTWLLEYLRDQPIEIDIARLHFNWELKRLDFPEKINAVQFWQNVTVGSVAHIKSRTKLRRFQMLRSALRVNAENQTVEFVPESIKRLDQIVQQELDPLVRKSEKISNFALIPKFLLSLVKWGISFRKKQIQANPEKALLEELIRFAGKRQVVFFLDNHDLANAIEIHTRLGHTDSSGHPQWTHNPVSISFTEYLKRLHEALFSKSKVQWLTLVTGRAELPFSHHIPSEYLARAKHLSAFTQYSITQHLTQEEALCDYAEKHADAQEFMTDKEQFTNNQFEAVSLSILKLTRGNPLLVSYSIHLLLLAIRESNAALTDLSIVWKEEIRHFKVHKGKGFDSYVKERLVERITNNERIKNALWRLCIPYRLLHDAKLADILFPLAEDASDELRKIDPFEQLKEVGIVKFSDDDQKRIFLHLVSLVSLKAVAAGHASECEKLHQALEDYFKAQNQSDAQRYHLICGRERHLFKSLNKSITPETYWELTTASLKLTEKEKKRFLYAKLPKTPTLNKRAALLLNERETLGAEQFCGDAALFLRHKFREEELMPEAFNDLKTIELLIKEAPHLSDLHFKKAMLEPDEDCRYAILQNITESINSAHAHSWFHRAVWERNNNRFEDSCRSFSCALAYGVRNFYADYANAMIFWAEADHDTALNTMKQAYKTRPDFFDLREELAALLIYMEHFDEALKVLQSGDQPNERNLFLQMEAAYRKGSFENAEMLLEQFDINSITDEWEIQRIETRKEQIDRQSRPVQADKRFKDIQDDSGHLSMLSGVDESEAEHLISDSASSKEKIEALQEMIEKNPDDHDAWSNLGNAYYHQGQYAQAIEAYLKAIEFKPDYHYAWNNLGITYGNQGQYAEAIEACLKAIEFKPDYHNAWYNLGNAYDDQGQYAQAIEAYRKAIEFKPDFHGAWNNLGVTYDNQGQYAQAIEACLKAVKFKPDYHYAWSNLGNTYDNQGQYAEAIEACLKAIEFKPDLHQAWHNLSVAYERQGSAGLAQKFSAVGKAIKATALESVDDSYQADSEDWLLVAKEVWAAYHYWDRAMSCVQKALEIEPDHPDALALAAEAALENERPEDAQAYLNRLEEVAPRYAPAYLAFTKLLIQQNRTEEAQAALWHTYDQHFIEADEAGTYLEFSNLFEQLNMPEKAIQCCINACGSDGYSELFDYHHVRILWQRCNNITEAKKTLESLFQKNANPMPQIYILDAEIALATGNFRQCRTRLMQTDAHDELIFLSKAERDMFEELNNICL